jgi:23S rRNA (adenine2030-N6)-methyltransferase
MAELLNTLHVPSLRVELNVRAPEKDFGMYGSGMFIINPPWLLHDQLKVLMPQLQMLLAKSGASDFILQYSPAIA